MSGTSLDGLDVAHCRAEGSGPETHLEIEYFKTVPYREDFRSAVREIFAQRQIDFQQLVLLNPFIGLQHGGMILECLAEWGIDASEVDLIARKNVDRTEWLNAIGQYSPFHETLGYYADPVDDTTATLPKGWKGRLVNLPPGDTEGVKGLCLDPHDLAIAKYVARREKDLVFTRELARRGIVTRKRLLELLKQAPVEEVVRKRIRGDIRRDFAN